MKRTMKAAIACVLMLGNSLLNNISAQRYDDYDRDRDVSYQTFYDDLSPHGRWVDYPGHGYVWVPDAGNDFRPYSTNGHWVWTEDYEWMWVSDYDWGWAPFHYGRWDYDDYYGWYWVPGYEWSPAWVAWRDGGDYYGWAPIRPGIYFNNNYNIGGYAPPIDFWSFAPRRYITSPRIYDHYLDRRRNVTIIHQTNIIINNFQYSNNYGFRSGPRRYDAEVYCGRINPVRFRQSYTPGRTIYRDNEVNVYRPSIRQNSNREVAPRSFERYDRNNGSFRNRNTNNSDVRRDDNTFHNRDNATPNRTDIRADNDRPFRRPDDNATRPPQQNDNNIPQQDRRRFDRPGNNSQPRTDDRRIYQPSPGNGGNNDYRRFERRTESPGRQPDVRTNDVPRPQQPPIERREQRQPRFERSQDQRQPPIERRFEQRQSQQPQVEGRQEQPRERSFERRSDEGGKPPEAANENGRGRARF